MSTETRLYVGCYTTTSPVGIRVFDATAVDGSLAHRSDVDDIEHASFLAASPDRSTLYAVSETVDRGKLVAYRISPEDGSLTRLDEASSRGSAPCHVSTRDDHVYVANYASGTVAAYVVQDGGRFARLVGPEQYDGSGPHPRQDAPHAHCIVASPYGDDVYATDLGTDRIVRYSHESRRGTDGLQYIDETTMAPGAGPRHLVFHPDRPIAFVVCELDNSLVALDVDARTGRLHPRGAVSTLPSDFSGDSIAAEVSIHPAGHRIYVSNRGHDSIATFAIDTPDALPALLGYVSSGGRTPRHFAVHPSGRTMLVANQDSGTIVSFDLDVDAAVPRQTGVVARASQPVCLTFVEVGR